MVFDITLPQLLVVFAVGAATLGPRDLPRAARSLGFLTGRAAKYVRESARTANELLQQAEIPEVTINTKREREREHLEINNSNVLTFFHPFPFFS